MKKSEINIDVDTAIEQALKIPGVGVNRESFLTSKFSDLVTPAQLDEILNEGP